MLIMVIFSDSCHIIFTKEVKATEEVEARSQVLLRHYIFKSKKVKLNNTNV